MTDVSEEISLKGTAGTCHRKHLAKTGLALLLFQNGNCVLLQIR